jgi:hypothetical protein
MMKTEAASNKTSGKLLTIYQFIHSFCYSIPYGHTYR